MDELQRRDRFALTSRSLLHKTEPTNCHVKPERTRMSESQDQTSAARIIELLEMQSHPEGGYYSETFRDDATIDGRSVGTAIYYLLERGDRSHWHRVDAAEIWHWYAGASLELQLSQDGEPAVAQILGTALEDGERPQIAVPQGCWQSARSLGDWTLVGCTVAPGFQFSGFEMAADDWQPGKQ